MAYYRIELGYRTKRGGVSLGMTVKAFDPDEAQDIARARHIDPFKARKFCFAHITEATKSEIEQGVINEGRLERKP